MLYVPSNIISLSVSLIVAFILLLPHANPIESAWSVKCLIELASLYHGTQIVAVLADSFAQIVVWDDDVGLELFARQRAYPRRRQQAYQRLTLVRMPVGSYHGIAHDFHRHWARKGVWLLHGQPESLPTVCLPIFFDEIHEAQTNRRQYRVIHSELFARIQDIFERFRRRVINIDRENARVLGNVHGKRIDCALW